jgi:hypothetical protein
MASSERAAPCRGPVKIKRRAISQRAPRRLRSGTFIVPRALNPLASAESWTERGRSMARAKREDERLLSKDEQNLVVSDSPPDDKKPSWK